MRTTILDQYPEFQFLLQENGAQLWVQLWEILTQKYCSISTVDYYQKQRLLRSWIPQENYGTTMTL